MCPNDPSVDKYLIKTNNIVCCKECGLKESRKYFSKNIITACAYCSDNACITCLVVDDELLYCKDCIEQISRVQLV